MKKKKLRYDKKNIDRGKGTSYKNRELNGRGKKMFIARRPEHRPEPRNPENQEGSG